MENKYQEGEFWFEGEEPLAPDAGASPNFQEGDFWFEGQEPKQVAGVKREEGDFWFEPMEPAPKPWYEANIDLPEWISKEGWNKNVEAFNDSVRRATKNTMDIAKDPWIVAEGITDIAQKTPGFIGGVLAAGGQIVKDLASGKFNLNDLYNSAAETNEKVREAIDKYAHVYDPKNPEAAEFVGEVAFSPATAWMIAGNEIAESDAVNALPEGVRDFAKGALKFGGDIGGLVFQGKVSHGAMEGLKGADPAAAAKGATGPAPLDTTWAKDEILQRINKERAATKQRPLDTLVRKEESIRADAAEEARLAPRRADLEAAFGGRPAEAFTPKEYGEKLGDMRKQMRIDEQTAKDMEKFGRTTFEKAQDTTPKNQEGLPYVEGPQLKETGRWVEPTVPVTEMAPKEIAAAPEKSVADAVAKEKARVSEVPEPEVVQPEKPVVQDEPPKTDAAGVVADQSGATPPNETITQWHGSPHKYEVPSTDRIGSGEGQTVFGWGLYYSDRVGVGKYYRDTLGKRVIDYSKADDKVVLDSTADVFGKEFPGFSAEDLTASKAYEAFRDRTRRDLQFAKKELDNSGRQIGKTSTYLEDAFTRNFEYLFNDLRFDKALGDVSLDQYINVGVKGARKFAKGLVKQIDKKLGNLYEVEVTAKADKFKWLRWEDAVPDKVITEVSKKLGRGINPRNVGSGRNLYRLVASALGSDKKASMFFDSLGYDGVEYPIGTFSGVKKKVGNNHVMFSGDRVKVKSINRKPLKTDATGILTDQPGVPLKNGKMAKPAPNGVENKGIYTDQRLGSFEVPELKSTNDALDFGEVATPEQISRLETSLENSRAKSAQLRQAAKTEKDPAKQAQMMEAGMAEAQRGQFIREALESSRGEHPHQVQMRKLADIARDVNTIIGKKGSIGRDLGGLNPEQRAAYDRLAKDWLAIRRNAKRVGKSTTDYLVSLKVDPVVAGALERNSSLITAHAAAIYGQDILKRYEDAAGQPLREGKYAGSVNMSKMDIPESAKQTAQAIAANMPERKPMTWAETDEITAKKLNSPSAARAALRRVGRIKAGDLTSDIGVARQTTATMLEPYGKILKDKLEGKITTEEYNTAIANLNEGLFRETSEASSEIGRALNSLRKTVKAGDFLKEVEALGGKINERQAKLIQKVYDKILDGTITPEEYAEFVKVLPDPKFTDYLMQMWYNNILSGPVTHEKNFMSNTSWALAQIPLRGTAGAIDALLHPLDKSKRTRYVNEVIPLIKGYGKGYTRGKSAAAEMFKKGRVEGVDSKWAIDMGTAATAFERSPSPTVRAIAPAFTYATRALRAMDTWANAVAYDGQLAALARRAANKKGLKGAERTAFEKKFMENPPDEAITEAQRFARHSTFMDEADPFTKAALTARSVGPVGKIAQLTVIPFVNTLVNLTKRGMEITPGVGLIKEGLSYGTRQAVRNANNPLIKAVGSKWAEGREYSVPDIMAKQVAGLTLSYLMLQKAAKGRITGPMPETEAERNFWYQNGITPWSVRIGGEDSADGVAGSVGMGGEWVSYRWAEPFNMTMAAAAAFHNRIRNSDTSAADIENYFKFGADMWQNIIDAPYLQGIQKLTSRHESKSDVLMQPLIGFVPYSSAMRTLARTYEAATEGAVKPREEPQVMEGTFGDIVNPFMKSLAQTIPGVSGLLPAKVNVYGEEKSIPGGVFDQWLPVKFSPTTYDKVEQMLARAGVYPSLPEQKVTYRDKSYKIPTDVYREYCIDYGSDLKERFSSMVDRRDWEGLTAERRKDRLLKAKDKAQDRARKYLIRYMRSHGMFNETNEVKSEKTILPNL